MTAPGYGERFKRFWLVGHRQARIDICNRWQRAAVCLWFLGLCACFGILYPFSKVGGGYSSACLPDGRFGLEPGKFKYWSRSGFFQITLGFGHLTFEQAKAIDVMWDVVFGRGGQALLAMVSWSVFVKYVTTSMEVMPVTFATYRTIFLQDQAPIFAIPRLIRDFSTRLALHSRFAMTFMIISMIFIWAFPTLGSAMTGYSSNVKPFVPDAENNLISFGKFSHHLYTIHDGKRINQSNEYMVGFSQAFGDDPVLGPYDPYTRSRYESGNYGGLCYSGRNHRFNNGFWQSEDDNAKGKRLEECNMLRNVTDYVKKYLSKNSNNISTTIFNKAVLPPPVLNITGIYLNDELFEMNYTNRETNPFNDPKRRRWNFQGHSFDEAYIKRHSTCQAVENYQWGFSFVQLNLMIVFLAVWTIGLSLMWVRAHNTMQKRGRETVAGEYKAIIELADAMQEGLTRLDEKTDFLKTLEESSLRRRIDKDMHGGSIAYTTPLLANGEHGSGDSEWGILDFLKKEGWWIFFFVGFAVTSIVLGFLFSVVWLFIWFVGIASAITLTVSIGSTGKSRFIIFWWSFWAFSVVPGLGTILWAVFTPYSSGSRSVNGIQYGV